MPLLFSHDMACKEGFGDTKVVGGRTVGCGSGKSPGGLLQISLLGTGGKSFVDGIQTDVFMHDGSQLSSMSAALKIASGKVVLGSPSSGGILICTIP